MLAASALRAGYESVVIDLFADLDTRQTAMHCYAVPSLALADLLPAVELITRQFELQFVVYGSGLEPFPDSLALLQARFCCYGNSLETFNRINKKDYFFAQLDAMHIAHPEVAFDVVPKLKRGLLKPSAGEGGVGILPCSANVTELKEGFYWQRWVAGVPMSALFLADGHSAQLIGFNRQWTVQPGLQFCGLINHAPLVLAQQKEIKQVLKQIVAVFALTGLNSLDFIYDGTNCQILEVNARPSASMCLYDSDFSKGLLYEHIRACDGDLIDSVPAHKNIRAYEVLYAVRSLEIPETMSWPLWAMDRPASASVIEKKQPVCSIMASAKEAGQVRAILQHRKQIIFNQIESKLPCNTQPV